MSVAEPKTRRFTRDEYYKMAEAGLFDVERVELIEGEIVVLSPQKPEHFTALTEIARVLDQCFGPGFCVRLQGSIDLGTDSEPEPDIAVVAGSTDDYRKNHPRTALLIVEVSDLTLLSDRSRKGSLYAQAGIGEYWMVNLVDNQLETYRNAIPDPSETFGFRYADARILKAGDFITPLAKTSVQIPVAKLLRG